MLKVYFYQNRIFTEFYQNQNQNSIIENLFLPKSILLSV